MFRQAHPQGEEREGNDDRADGDPGVSRRVGQRQRHGRGRDELALMAAVTGLHHQPRRKSGQHDGERVDGREASRSAGSLSAHRAAAKSAPVRPISFEAVK